MTALIVAGLALAPAAALYATRPPGTTLGRHVAAQLGQIVLDVYRAALRVLVGAVVVLAVLAAAWSWVQPRIVGAVRSGVQSAADAATPDLPSVPSVDLDGAKNTITDLIGGKR